MTRRCSSCEALYPADFLVCPRDATPLLEELSPDADPRVGALVGDTYQIVRVVGEGGMGRVYEARHLRLKERRFAIKALHADLAKNAEIVARFLREAESASSLSHPHVVDVFDVHHLADGTPYLVGEFLEGEELAEYVAKNGPLSPKMAAIVGHQICSALSAAHARGIVHRDMKPENVFVLRATPGLHESRSGSLRVKVLDFGISKSGSERTHLTKTGMIMGTPSYMAPEQARGQAVDHRADVYAVGAVLYYALTGHKPFDSEDPTSTLTLVLTRDPVRLRTLASAIPEGMELVVQRAMAKDPADRYASMDELAAALRSLDRGDATSIAPEAPMVRESTSAWGRTKDLAKGVVGLDAPNPSPSLVRYARPTIVVTSLVLATGIVSGVASALAGAVRLLHGDDLTMTESVLLGVACLFALLTPASLYVAHVKRAIWPNSVRAVTLASDLRRSLGASLVTYGALMLGVRVVFTLVLRDAKSLASGAWDIVLFLVSALVALAIGGGGALLRRRFERRS